MPKKPVRKTAKKPVRKTAKKPVKKISKKLFKIGDVSTDDILLGAGTVGGLLGLGLLAATKLKKKRMEDKEAKEALEINKTVIERLRLKAVAAKEKTVADMKKITETYSATTTPRTSSTTLFQIQPVPQSSSKIEKIKQVLATVKKNVQKFTSDQKQEIVSILKKGGDIGEYIEKITGRKYIPSNIKLSKGDHLDLQLHVIEGAARGYNDSDISQGLEKLRADIKDRKDIEKMNDILTRSGLLIHPSSNKKFKFPTLRK